MPGSPEPSDGRGPQVLVDPLSGKTVVIIGHRQKRPNLPSGDCPFCPGGLEAPDDYDVFSFPNRFPPISNGRAEVVLYTPDHGGELWSQPVAQVEKVIELWEQRTQALGARSDVSYVLIFENRGAEVGATIPHPHGQIYGFESVPEAPQAELDQPGCSLCDEPPDGHLIVDSQSWRAWSPPASMWPHELLLAPRRHWGDLPDAGEARRDLAIVLRQCLAKLDHLFDAPMPYMMWFHQRPCDGDEWPQAHVHLHIAPLYRSPNTRRYVAAGEVGSGVYFNPVVPAESAELLRQAIGAP